MRIAFPSSSIFELYHSKGLQDLKSDLGQFEIDLKNLETFCYETPVHNELVRMCTSKLEQFTSFNDFRMNTNFACLRDSLRFKKVRSFFCEKGFELPNLELLYFNIDLQIRIVASRKPKGIHHFYLKYHRVSFAPDRTQEIFKDLFAQRSSLNHKLLIYFDGNRWKPDSLFQADSFES